MTTGYTFSITEKNSMDRLFGILPVRKSELVIGRYVFVLAMGLLSLIISLIAQPLVLKVLGETVGVFDRMKGAMDAIGLHGEDLDVVLMQMVNLMRDGQPIRMSKRTGNAITLTDLLEEVPIDSARFLFNMHDAGSGIDFDLDQAVKTDNDNPVYYVQYAHARICSILKKMESEGVAFAGAENIDATPVSYTHLARLRGTACIPGINII